ncbi:SMP-30/gluconolactonase/LRE family protein [Sphingomonas bisphenolicum]|uniref:Gluconolactonase n=1 Tax=Sphingomonas bisphenolicum TaxID=296544 RepID=A0ABM7G414_9SPHN|nr:SMP-30/gluconolactonase/LRE family protein [Sphingomonas bisphenolicum]BBF71979.1 gluconolactonase [Sphingomonas bisphenolicum]
MRISQLVTAGFLSLLISAQVWAGTGISSVCGACRAVKIATCGGFLEGPSHDAQGQLWVVDVTGGRILQIADGQCKERAKTGGHPNGSLVTKDGNLLIADRTGLVSFDPRSGTLSSLDLSFGGEKLSGLNDLAKDAHGGLYFTVPGMSSALRADGRLFYRDPQGHVQLVSDKFSFPNGVAVSSDGETVLVADFAAKRIVSVPAIGAKGPNQLAYVFSATQGGIGPDGMKIDAKGRLFAANLGAREILAYDRDGTQIGVIALPEKAGPLVTNVAVNDHALYITEGAKGEVWKVDLLTNSAH